MKYISTKSLVPFLMISLILFAGLTYYFRQTSPSVTKTQASNPQTQPTISVVTSFYPLAEFARQVGKQNAQVTNITSNGVEPHDFEPTPQDIIAIQNAHLFIINGAEFEPWACEITPQINLDKTYLMNTSAQLAGQLIKNDPHFWLDPILAIEQVKYISEGYIQRDPDRKSLYEQNAASYISELQKLDFEFKTGLSQCEQNTIITSHNAFSYLGKRYNFSIKALAGLSPDEEPSPQQMAKLTNYAKANNIKYVLFETLVSPKLAETIANEIGATTLVLNPLEGLTSDEMSMGKNYLSIQRENLATLKTALNCQ